MVENLSLLESIVTFLLYSAFAIVICACLSFIKDFIKDFKAFDFNKTPKTTYNSKPNRFFQDMLLREKVLSESPQINKLKELNKTFDIYTLPPQHFYKECCSKAEYDRIYLIDFLEIVVNENINTFLDLEIRAKENYDLYLEYLQEYESIEQEVLKSEKDRDYQAMEISLLTSMKKKVEPYYEIILTKSYSSPKGRNTYSYQKTYRNYDIDYIIDRAVQIDHERKQQQSQIEYERSLMTNSLRYDILKRDEFKCTICGATANDGVKLHVDHIFPVSKGGKTVPENLRTLCARCNSGKKDKYDPYGFN